MTIDENEIIRIYGKRWDIEVFFKTCKSFLKLGTEYHGLSYDALTVPIRLSSFCAICSCQLRSEMMKTIGQ
jgi:hypothetical protein